MEDKEEAVPFLIYDSNTKIFTLTVQGEEVIKSINSNFGVISVAGMYRTGKSYLLNRMLLNRQKGFSVGPTVNPCTKGLWIWSKPIYGTAEDGSRMPVLLIDTEGFGAFDEDQNHDVRIFTLAILLSSYFVYNSLGSIDENAIQSLNFVINLSKHIQLKSNSNVTESDPQELANLFPSFLWILRDFSLQLVDENGETITAKEYLEKVLDVSNTYSEQEQKIKIRKLIKAYFKDRDCFTMIRPLLKEKELQSLENMGPEKLRPEFLEQILHLRKKILGRVKVKTFKNKPLNSEMYINLIKGLINSINTGKVPSIENTWNSMCKVECYKAFEEAERIYEALIRENSMNNNGLGEEAIKKIHSEAKEKSIEVYRIKALGESAVDYEKQLKNKIKEKYSYYSKLNEEETKNSMLRVLQKWYSMLEYKIQAGELKDVDEIENDFKQLEYKINETFPCFNQRNELFYDFKSKILNFAGDFFLNKMNNEIKLVKNENNQMINKLSNEITDIKNNYEREIIKKNNVIESVKNENSELKEKLNELKESLVLLEREKDLSNKNLSNQTERLREDYERRLNDLHAKSMINEDKLKETERKAITIQAEADRERALLEQKIEHYSKQIEEFTRREKESGQELKSQLKEQTIAFKESTIKYETQIKNLNSINEQLKEKILDIESSLNNKETLYEAEKIRADDLLKKFNIETKDLSEKLASSKKLFQDEKIKNSDEIKRLDSEFSNKISLLKVKEDEQILKFKNTEENMKSRLIKFERENAIMKQNNEFLEIKVKELESQMEEQKKAHENIISTLESKTFSMVGHEEFQKKVDDIKSYFENEKKQTEESFEKSKLIYISQIDHLSEKLNENEFKGKINREELERELNEIKNKFEKLQKEYSIISSEKKNLSKSLQDYNEDLQNKIKIITIEYENKLEEKERMNQREILELNKSSEEMISQLKALFETEKIRFEEKMKEEKIRNERKIKYALEECDIKIKERETELLEEIENLQNDLSESENNYHNYVSNAEYDNQMLHQKIETLENNIRDAKEIVNKIQAQSTQNLEQISENFNKERKDLNSKIEVLSSESSAREKEITSLQLKRDNLERTISEKDRQINTLRKEYDDERKEIVSKLENYKSKFLESNDDNMIKKLEHTRESALLKQQIEFLNKKIEELQKTNEDGQRRYDERLFSLRTEVEKDLNEKFERLKKDKEELEAKLLQKKKELRDLEQTFIKEKNLTEKEKSSLTEKISYLEEDKKDLVENHERELSILNNSLKILKEEYSSTREDLSSNKESLKKRIITLEVDLQEKTSLYEKEQILWDGKFKFIEQQRDTFKRDLADSQKRFEQLLDNIQRKGNLEKEKLEINQNNAIAALETKYQTQIKESQEAQQKLCSDLLTSNKELERELKSVNLQLEIFKNKAIDPSIVSKQIEEHADEKDKLKKLIEDMKKEKDLKIMENQSFSEKEKDILKLKMSETESRLREVEGKRGALLLEYEKDKAKWSLEKDHFYSKTSEFQENIDRLEKKIEVLLRENEKLKTDKNNAKRSTSNNFVRAPGQSIINSSILGNIGNIKDMNMGGYNSNYKDKDSLQSNQPKINNVQNNPYDKVFSKLFEGVDMNNSKVGDKSFEQYDSSKYDKYDNPYNKFSHKYSIRPSNKTSTTSSTIKEEENGNGNSERLGENNGNK